MTIPCIRCGAHLDRPNKKNAKYIINHDDERTYGDMPSIMYKTQYSDICFEHESLNAANIAVNKFLDMRREKIKTIQQKIEKEISLKNIVAYKKESEELTNEQIHVTEHTVMKRVPKTGIVCLKCVQIDDFIIW